MTVGQSPGFGDELRRLLAERGMSLRELSRRAHCDAGYLSKIMNGRKPASPHLARILDEALEADGVLKERATVPALNARPARSSNSTTAVREIPRVVQALAAVEDNRIADARHSLTELVSHYAHIICVLAPSDVYDEILAVRKYAGRVIEREGGSAGRADIVRAAGFLSALLGIAACDMGEHGAARVWCSDAERRSEEIGHPELAGWAILTRTMIAFYQGQPYRSASLASHGQAVTKKGGVAHARLAAQEMRAAAMFGDLGRMSRARQYATKAIVSLPSVTAQTGAFSITVGEDPPYTATSLLFAGRFRDAVAAANKVIQMAYRSESLQRGEHPSGYARCLLILALAQAGLGHLDEAIAAGHTALACGRPAWPTTVLAGKLDHVLCRDFPNTVQVAAYHDRYLDTTRTPAGHYLQLPVPCQDRR